LALALCSVLRAASAFAPSAGGVPAAAVALRRGLPAVGPLRALPSAPPEGTLLKVPEDDDTPIPFVDERGASFIECYADSIATIGGATYTIGSPCDCSVALTYFGGGEKLMPVELDSELMDDVFPVAESIVEEEFGDELGLQRTPQTLTLVGELEAEDEEDDEEYDDEGEDVSEEEEEVEILLSFEHKGMEFHMVRLLDPVLLVGKEDPESPDRRILLTPKESDEVMPLLEEMFLSYQDDAV